MKLSFALLTALSMIVPSYVSCQPLPRPVNFIINPHEVAISIDDIIDSDPFSPKGEISAPPIGHGADEGSQISTIKVTVGIASLIGIGLLIGALGGGSETVSAHAH